MSRTRIEESLFSRLERVNGKPAMPCGTILIERKLDDRPSGSVFLAQHLGLDRPVILRVMHPEVTARVSDNEALRAWAQRLARVRHENVGTIYDLGKHHDHSYLILEYVLGVPMTERIKVRPYTPAEALMLLTPIANGLAAYWREGVLHRGMSPQRVSITAEGRPMLDLVVLPPRTTDSFMMNLHAPFMAGYWAPEEMALVPDPDPRADMFSFGACLFYALSGESPYGKGTTEALLERMRTQPPADVKQKLPDLPAALREFLSTCLQTKREARYATPRDFLDALQGAEDCLECGELPQATGRMRAAFARAAGARTAYAEGETLGNCSLISRLGAGAFGIVYLARHRVLDIEVAVKLLPLDIAEKDPLYIDLFLREARTAARVRHPNVIAIFEAGEQEGQYYLVMEYAPGGSLFQLLQERGGKLRPAEALPILRDAARGLAAAERLNIIHRDIKPDNLIFGAGGTLKIADLGLAKRIPHGDSSASLLEELRRDQLTIKAGQSSQIVGTPAYMAPELAMRPQEADTRADQYALGCTAYEMLAGMQPLVGENSFVTIMKQIHNEPTPLRSISPEVPTELAAIVEKMMKKDPNDRFARASDLVSALENLAL
ncbi:MAG: hypothetical protein AMXMBFR7_14830 [Planctomycetota bacterium]